MVKQCRECWQVKPLDDFYKHGQTVDRRQPYCITCFLLRSKRYRERNKEAIWDRARTRSSKPENMRKIRARGRIWWANNREKARAQQRANYAVKIGRLQRRFTCERCNSTRSVQKHHPNYSKPLDVVWLCRSCHAYADRDQTAAGLKRLENDNAESL